MACYSGRSDFHAFWADIVKSYALRNMTNTKDRLTALSGLAAKYLSTSSLDEYLAGIWAKNLAEGLAWKLEQAVENCGNKVDPMVPKWPSWS